MIKSDSAYYNSSSSSTGSDCYSENNKSIDTVTQLFSNLLKNSESSTNLRKSPAVENLRSPESEEKRIETPKDKTHEGTETRDDSLNVTNERQKSTSSDTVIDKSKEFCTPFNSKIPVLHPKSDPVDLYETDKTPIGRKLPNASSLKKICSNSKIPVRSIKKNQYEPNKSSVDFLRSRQTLVQTKKPDKSSTGKYNHVKSKLAAYIHRPSKIDSKYVYSSNAKNNSRVDTKKTKEDYVYANSSNCIRRDESRTSLDTYTCDYKIPFPDFNYSDCCKSEDQSSCQKAREHLDEAAQHCRIQFENRRIVEEHQRLVAKHQRIALEHEEKAHEHQLKAIASILNKIT